MTRRDRTLVPLLTALLAGVLALAPGATATASPTPGAQLALARSPYAPLDRPGPELHVPHRALVRALSCHGRPHHGPEPVLLNPATGVTPKQNYSWNYERAFTAQHRYWCAVTMPQHTLEDIQRSGEFLVFAIRWMHHHTARRIAVLGHSQGGMSMRWALRFWPDTRRMVTDVIGMAGSNHGTTALLCGEPVQPACPPADWQQRAGAHFIQALNSRAETFRGISYTEIYTHTDEVVRPNSSPANSSSSLHTGRGRITNVATQQVCPTDVYEHLTVGTVDPVTYALVMDALTHRGPAKPARVPRTVCARLYQPGVDPTNAQTYLQSLAAVPGLLTVSTPLDLVGAPEVRAEPRLRCYVFRHGC
ncbi:esterase/lipase family protein [Nocardioides terrisoli]|uniref:esterase/lipase family protein n=1 Tax=Nocardioides terrisoli TaxID=3388267 RepID=UPI00287BB9AC|nr:lipase [Nocardioides marmorisolisilvae]